MASYSLQTLVPDYCERQEFTIMMTPKQKYLLHSYSRSLASYSHGSSSPTAASHMKS